MAKFRIFSLGKINQVLATFFILSLIFVPISVLAATQNSSDSVNVTAIVYGPPPSTPAVISSPKDGTITNVTPLVVSGTCGPGLTVKVFDNGDLVGTTTCTAGGTFTINMTLIFGVNKLTALNYDTLDQAGPASPTVTITVEEPKNSTQKSNHPFTGQSDKKPNNQAPKTSHNPANKKTFPLSFVSINWLLFVLLTSLFVIIGLKLKCKKSKELK